MNPTPHMPNATDTALDAAEFYGSMNSTPQAQIYVIEDDATVLNSIRWVLEGEKWTVVLCQSVRDFIKAKAADTLGCVILDMDLPDSAWLDLNETLQQEITPMPLILMAGWACVEEAVQAIKSGVLDFLEKPVDPARLLTLVDQAVQIHRLNREVYEIQKEVSDLLDLLTSRERQVARLLVHGMALKTIATTLSISHQTAAKHRTKVLEKLRVHSDAELIRLLMDHSLDL